MNNLNAWNELNNEFLTGVESFVKSVGLERNATIADINNKIQETSQKIKQLTTIHKHMEDVNKKNHPILYKFSILSRVAESYSIGNVINLKGQKNLIEVEKSNLKALQRILNAKARIEIGKAKESFKGIGRNIVSVFRSITQ